MRCLRLILIVAAAGYAIAWAGGAAAFAGEPDVAGGQPSGVIDTFAYADAAAARTQWQPMFGSAAVDVATVDGRPCLKMPCTFAGTTIDRASWDRKAPVDLSDRRGVRFQMYVGDPSPVGHFTIFFHSGDGWYAAGFSPQARGRWHTVTVEKRDTKVEGRPAGWGRVDTIRISAWRGRNEDTAFHLANLEVFGRPADVAVVRAESLIRAGSGEAEGIAQYTQRMVGMLEDAGLRVTVVSDLDLAPNRLARKRLLVLPHNPTLPDTALKPVTNWLDAGGRLIVCYTMPAALREATGIAAGAHVRQKERGDFAEIRFRDGALPGAPPVVGQASWNVHKAEARSHGARVVANWFNAAGQDTGLPAVVVSERAALVTHVLLPDDPKRKPRMLLAMAGHLVPDLWQQAAEGAVAGIGHLGPFHTFNEAVAGIRRTAAGRKEALTVLQEAADRCAVARQCIADRQWPEAVDAAAAARRLLVRARCLAQPALAGEHRNIWCHSAFGPTEKPWDDEMRVLAENGFTAILPNMLWGGVAYYQSKVLPVAPEVAERGDQVAECVAACRKHGVECHVWKVNWNMGWRAPKNFVERMRREGRVQVGFDGSVNARWLCPSHPENRRLEIESMVEVATRYDVHGIHFDYIRYPGRDGCFCPGCRERFEKAVGRKVANWPKDVRADKGLHAAWLDFRRAQITAVVEAVHRHVKKLRPECQISAAVFRNWPVHRDQVGQDWKDWCERGLLDFVCPMDYTPSNLQFEAEVTNQRAWAAGVPCYPGIGLTTWPDRTDISRLIDQIRITREAKTGGFTVFHYGDVEMREVIPLAGLGITLDR